MGHPHIKFCLYDLLHTLQENGRDPVCICSCLTQSDFCLTDLLHTLQKNGWDPVCIHPSLPQTDFCLNGTHYKKMVRNQYVTQFDF